MGRRRPRRRFQTSLTSADLARHKTPGYSAFRTREAQMIKRWFGSTLLIVCLLGALVSPSFGQSGEPRRFGAGAKFSTLGIGIEGATSVTEQSNVRGGM